VILRLWASLPESDLNAVGSLPESDLNAVLHLDIVNLIDAPYHHVHGYGCRPVWNRETRERWPLLTVETKVNRDSKKTN
jgi:hypothetical protein